LPLLWFVDTPSGGRIFERETADSLADILERTGLRRDAFAEAVTSETSLSREIGEESLDLVELAMEIEQTFDLQIREEDVGEIQSIADLLDYIQERKRKREND
jgi:acyl carrier protein